MIESLCYTVLLRSIANCVLSRDAVVAAEGVELVGDVLPSFIIAQSQ